MLPAPQQQPERPALTTTCPIMRKKTLSHRQIQLAISTYGNNDSGTWTGEEKTWLTAIAIMSKLQILTQQNQAKSHTAPHDATANHSDWILQSLSPASHPMPYVFACHTCRWVTPSMYLLSPARWFSVSNFTVYPSTTEFFNSIVSSLLSSCLRSIS